MRYFILLAALMGLSCRGVAEFDKSDFPQVLYTPEYADGFEILATEQGDATLIVVEKPWQGEKSEPRMLLLDPNNRFADVSHPHLQRISGKVERIVCLSSSYIAMLDAIGQADAIVGVSGKEFIYNEKIMAQGDKIGDIGYDGHFNLELLLSLKPDLVLLYGLNSSSGLEEHLDNFKIPYIYIGEYLEPSPLGKAEWVVALAEIMGCREQGERLFTDVAQRYNSVCDSVESYLQANDIARPDVLLNTPYRDVWYLPAPKSYIVQLIEDSGGHAFTAGKQGDTTTPIGIEQAYSLAHKADIWLNVGSHTSYTTLLAENPLFASVEVVKQRQVYNNNGRQRASLGSDFWESGVINPDVILTDLVKIIHPDLLDDKTLYYHRKLQ